MPHLRIETNVPASKVPPNFHIELCGFIAEVLDKPAEYCAVTIVTDRIMAFRGTDAPCGMAHLISIGNLGYNENKAHSKAILAKIEEVLGIPQDRIYLIFQDETASNIGHIGTTFHEIFARK